MHNFSCFCIFFTMFHSFVKWHTFQYIFILCIHLASCYFSLQLSHALTLALVMPLSKIKYILCVFFPSSAVLLQLYIHSVPFMSSLHRTSFYVTKKSMSLLVWQLGSHGIAQIQKLLNMKIYIYSVQIKRK